MDLAGRSCPRAAAADHHRSCSLQQSITRSPGPDLVLRPPLDLLLLSLSRPSLARRSLYSTPSSPRIASHPVRLHIYPSASIYPPPHVHFMPRPRPIGNTLFPLTLTSLGRPRFRTPRSVGLFPLPIALLSPSLLPIDVSPSLSRLPWTPSPRIAPSSLLAHLPLPDLARLLLLSCSFLSLLRTLFSLLFLLPILNLSRWMSYASLSLAFRVARHKSLGEKDQRHRGRVDFEDGTREGKADPAR